MKIDVKMSPPTTIIGRIKDNKTGTFVAETCGRYFNKYVPWRKGNLSQTYTTEPYKITYEMPYADRLYNGKGFKFSKLQHPLATSHWDKAAYAAQKDDIVNEISAYLQTR